MKRQRQWHLWIGIITSVFILIESITGLLLNERWILGMSAEEERRGMPQMVNEASIDNQVATTQQGTDQNISPINKGELSREGGHGGSGLMGIIRGLHEGHIGNVNIKWVMDLTAIGMIILTVTGISMSVKVLVLQRRKQRKEASSF